MTDDGANMFVRTEEIFVKRFRVLSEEMKADFTGILYKISRKPGNEVHKRRMDYVCRKIGETG